MVNLLIVRHAKTLWNLSGKIQGRSDIPLAEESVTAAFEMGKTLYTHIDAAYSSPLSRAADTAKLILEGAGESGVTLIKDERLTERDFGIYEGKTYEQLGLEDHTKLFFALDDNVKAEPVEEVFKRVRSFIVELKQKHDNQTVLIVSHGVCISFLIYALTHEKWDKSNYDMSYIPNLKAIEYKY